MKLLDPRRTFALVASLFLNLMAPPSAAAQFASSQIGYVAGTGANPRYNNPDAALGQPGRMNPFNDAVTPFSPPYDASQLLSIGAGGSLTVAFSAPVPNSPGNPFGLDFLIFGGAGLVITNASDADFNWIGEPATDGSLFGGNEATTRVSVSADGVQFFTLDPLKAPVVEGLFPTDGSGDFQRPVDPSLRLEDFAGLTLDGLRQKYNGGGGGTGYDIGWALDSSGRTVPLESIRLVRVEVLQGKIEIDSVGAVAAVPEPADWALLLLGAIVLRLIIRRR